MTSAIDGGIPPALYFATGFTRNVGIFNNAFVTQGGSPVVNVTLPVPQLQFIGNAYWSYTDPLRLSWLG